MAEPIIEDVRVIELAVHDFKRIQNVHIRPLGPVTPIIGENEAGKSSVLDSICAVLGGADWCPKVPVRRGAVDAAVRLDLGDIVAVRTWKAGGTKNGELSVYAKDGTELRRPQDVLNRFISGIAFDPTMFEKSKPAERLAMLARVANVDLDDFARRRQKLFNDRADVNKDIKRVEHALEGMPPADDEVPTTEVSVAAIMGKIEEAEKANREVERLNNDHSVAASRLNDARDSAPSQDDILAGIAHRKGTRLSEITEAIRKLKEEMEQVKLNAEEEVKQANINLESHKQTIATIEQQAKEAADAVGTAKMIDVTPLRDRIKSADAQNNIIRQQTARRTKAAEGNALLKRKAELEAGMEAIEAEKIAAVAAAKLPIPGLSLGEEDVMMTGPDGKGRIPFEQCSSAQKLTLSATIGLETNKLKLMLIHDGSLLDAKRMELLKSIAEKYKAQIIVERVASADSAEVGIRITEGYSPEEYAAAQQAKAALAAAQ